VGWINDTVMTHMKNHCPDVILELTIMSNKYKETMMFLPPVSYYNLQEIQALSLQ